MKKVLIIISILTFLLLVGAFIHAALQPKPFNWEHTYYSYDRDPFGGFVIFNEISNFFPGNKVKRLGKDDFDTYYSAVRIAFYQEDGSEMDSSLYLTDLFDFQIKEFNFFGLGYDFYLDEMNTRALLLHLYQGNHALISSYGLTSTLSDFTGIEIEHSDNLNETDLDKKYQIQLEGQDAVKIKPHDIFSKITTYPDSASVIAKNSEGDILGVRLKVGEGSLTFFTLPIVFSNYYILKESSSLSASLLKDLPNRDTFWANAFAGGYNPQQSRSLLSFIHSEPALTWAFYTLIFTVLIYLAFQVKREQRPIPVIQAPENVSLKFTEVISNLYLMKKNHREMVSKKMTFFLEQVRSRHHLETNNLNEKFFQRLSIKTKVELATVKMLFIKYDRLMSQQQVDKDDFLYFNKLIQNFKLNNNE